MPNPIAHSARRTYGQTTNTTTQTTLESLGHDGLSSMRLRGYRAAG